MPWTSRDVPKKTKKAKTAKQKRQWAEIADRLLAAGKSDGQAIREASGVIKKES